MDTQAPYTVVGFKAGYRSWRAAVTAAKQKGLAVRDRLGDTIYPHRPEADAHACADQTGMAMTIFAGADGWEWKDASHPMAQTKGVYTALPARYHTSNMPVTQ